MVLLFLLLDNIIARVLHPVPGMLREILLILYIHQVIVGLMVLITRV